MSCGPVASGARRWLHAGAFEQIVHDQRVITRFLSDRSIEPPAAIFDGRTLQSMPESGGRAGYGGSKKERGSKVHMAVDTLGNLLALKVTAANEREPAQVAELARKVQEVTGGTVEVAFVDQGYTGEDAAQGAGAEGIKLEVIKHCEAKRGSVLLPRGWVGRFRRLARDYERLAVTLAGGHWLAFVALPLSRIRSESA